MEIIKLSKACSIIESKTGVRPKYADIALEVLPDKSPGNAESTLSNYVQGRKIQANKAFELIKKLSEHLNVSADVLLETKFSKNEECDNT